ncbi:hypothetical protein SDC9_192426 [bioreactor metagenome]|uniref:Uncharacterized protein n=1 Tax=bioreactor metagenome TaxID=1076179 RepID=A0A645I334_9ZZZZ
MIGEHASHRIQLAQQLAPSFLALIRDSSCDYPFNFKPVGIRIAARGERFQTRAQETFLRKTALGLSEHHIRRNQTLVFLALEQSEHRPNTRVRQTFARDVRRLHQISRCLMPVVPMGHAADQ